ncbi:methylmalonyl Co-A mutase-associated GTPase MeaB [Calidifontibacillus erzurumensis]|uniref:Methylmalonyl Co-A mutase-associated GTPase MeaB n=1 Tax=Calidifontibacillus erzurumensis TaxID=2741433 RepID=A0A8J8KD81_9BACI|nr:methylmalonyl Co-A mutase-associated GTPase MeaB [Calidifontibacillus erzurumensis]NSL50410.1 methylmalonyl Co-A mutase-associated GTPase MeaB [Calidifontibacillus erzurumensis]
MENKNRPEWVPENADKGFATNIMRGVEGGHDGMESSQPITNFRAGARKGYSLDEIVDGILKNDRVILARAITLVESNAPKHIEKAQQILNRILPYTGNSLRIGITGVPGAGKSTFIEALGSFLCNKGHRVAVLAVDPSSSITGGSILGDKTRMEKLSRDKRAFIRPSPSGGTLGGVNRKTRETMLLCEAAGYDVILIETIGVGQSEVVVRSMVDLFALLVLTGAGDELQGMKKGVMELADLIIVNKADGDNEQKAMVAKDEYNRIVHYLRPATEGWQTKALTCSAYYEKGIDRIWEEMQNFEKNTKASGVFQKRRASQIKDWIYSMIKDELEQKFFNHPQVKKVLPEIEKEVVEGRQPVTQAVQYLFEQYEKRE